MPNLSVQEHLAKYEIYPNKGLNNIGLTGDNSIGIKLKSINRTVSTNKGFRNNKGENNDFR